MVLTWILFLLMQLSLACQLHSSFFPFFSPLIMWHWFKPHNFFLDLCALQKLCRENSNLVVSLLLLPPKQKFLFFGSWFQAQLFDHSILFPYKLPNEALVLKLWRNLIWVSLWSTDEEVGYLVGVLGR